MFEALLRKSSRLVIGLTSPTPVDRVDGALVSLGGAGTDLRLRVHTHIHLGYSERVRRLILVAADPEEGRIEHVCRTAGLLGELFAQAAFRTAENAGVGMTQVDLIGSHGQTLGHRPRPEKIAGVSVTSSLEVGHPALIAERTGVTTVADFRPRDMAAGGQGAPLGAYADYLLFRNRARGRLILNLGGIASLTALPPGCSMSEVTAFDAGPGGMLSDLLVADLTGDRAHQDPEGRYAQRGTVSPRLLDRLLDHPYLEQPLPKSCGPREFGSRLVETILKQRGPLSPADLIATATRFSATAVARAYRRFVQPHGTYEEMIVTGSGAKNGFLVGSLRELLPGLTLRPSDDYGLPAQAKEAVTYAVLANETLHLQPGNVPGATGARRPVVLGSIVPGSR